MILKNSKKANFQLFLLFLDLSLRKIVLILLAQTNQELIEDLSNFQINKYKNFRHIFITRLIIAILIYLSNVGQMVKKALVTSSKCKVV